MRWLCACAIELAESTRSWLCALKSENATIELCQNNGDWLCSLSLNVTCHSDGELAAAQKQAQHVVMAAISAMASVAQRAANHGVTVGVATWLQRDK